jgi:Xaa-Pro aminopeptidase
MVFTVEPGVYIPEESLGVRIEDIVLVTDTGSKLLSARLPRNADARRRIERGLHNPPVGSAR